MKTLNINTTDYEVADYLKSQGINYSVQLVESDYKKGLWICDKFNVTFSTNNNSKSFDFHTGLGHRIEKVPANIKEKRERLNMERLCFRVETVKHGRTAWEFCVSPMAASVLYSLILDSTAKEQCFDDWCDDFGYNSDSIHYFNLYRECCANADKLRKVFTSKQINKLKKLLEDY